MSSRVPTVVRCAAVQPDSMTATGVPAGLPCATSSAAARRRAALTPISSTSVPSTAASDAQSTPFVAGHDGDLLRARPRWVTGMPAAAGHGDRAGHAGDDLDGDAGGHAGQGLLAAAAEHERVAALEPHDPPAAPRACSTSSR